LKTIDTASNFYIHTTQLPNNLPLNLFETQHLDIIRTIISDTQTPVSSDVFLNLPDETKKQKQPIDNFNQLEPVCKKLKADNTDKPFNNFKFVLKKINY